MKTLSEIYKKEIIPAMRKKFGYKNDWMVPRLTKIVINAGIGRLTQTPNFEEKILPEISRDISLISGQKPKLTAAKKSIAGFKIRAGQTVGLKVTLRRKRMYDFLEKLIKIIFPRLRDFRGIDLKNIDSKGNLTVGFREQIVFPEISAETLKVDFGFEISIVSSAKNREEAMELYRQLGLPLKK